MKVVNVTEKERWLVSLETSKACLKEEEGELIVQIVSSKEKKKRIRKLLTSNENSENGNIEERVIVLFGKVKTGYFIFNNGEMKEVKAKFSKKEKFAVAFVKKMSNGRETVFSERLVLYIP